MTGTAIVSRRAAKRAGSAQRFATTARSSLRRHSQTDIVFPVWQASQYLHASTGTVPLRLLQWPTATVTYDNVGTPTPANAAVKRSYAIVRGCRQSRTRK